MQPWNKILKFSTFFFVFIVIFGFVGFSEVLRFAVKDQTALKRRNIMRKVYLKLPMALEFRVYFFNITNPSDVQNGKKPVVKEIGPYIYDDYKEKIDILENEGEDSLTYTPYDTYFFNEEKSGNLKDDDYVTILHPLIVGIVSTVNRDSPSLLPVVSRALKSIFNNPQNIYMTTRVKDILFDGVIINCTVQDFSVTAVCGQIKSQTPGLVEVEKKVYKFSLLSPRNGTLPFRYKVLRGIKKSHELGRLLEINHQKELTAWSTKKCNRYRGTDGWIFPPFINKELGVWSYSSDLCKNIRLDYVRDEIIHGVPVQKYYADLGDMSNNPEDKCYCPSAKFCLPRGVFDLTKCLGVPIYATLPHFLRVDRSVRKGVRGLKPVTEKHIIRVLIQPLLATPIEAEKRLQLNLPIQPVKRISFMSNLPTVLHPIFWVEECIILEGSILNLIKGVIIGLKVFAIVKYFLLGFASVGMIYGGYLQYKTYKLGKVTPIAKNQSALSKRSETEPKSETKTDIEIIPNKVEEKVEKF